MTSTIKQYYAATVVNVATLCYGTTIGWASPALAVLAHPEDSAALLPEGPITSEQASWVGGLLCLGAMVGTPLYAWLADAKGRKCAGYVLLLPYAISWMLIILGDTVPYLLAGRFFSGIGGGGIIVLVPIYVSEIADDRIRGALGSLLVLSINVGILVAYCLGAALSYLTFTIVLSVLPLLFLIGFIGLPETPARLVATGDMQGAAKAICWLKGLDPNKSEDEQILSWEMDKLKPKLDAPPEVASFKDLLTPWTLRGLLIGAMLMAAQQFCGLFAVLSYAAAIFHQAGSSLAPNQSAILLGSLQVIGGNFTPLLVERAGRKILLSTTAIGVGICLAALGVHATLRDAGYDVSGLGWLPVASLSTAVFISGMGLGPLPFVVVSEIFESKVKGKASSICNLLLWFYAFIILKFYNNMVVAMTMQGTFFFFASCMMLATLFVVFVVPETKGRPLSAILEQLGKKYEKGAPVPLNEPANNNNEISQGK